MRKILPLTIAALMTAGSAYAAGECVELEGAPPGLYTTTDEGRTFLIKDGDIVELGPGQTGFADETGVKCIERSPQFMDWPCSTDAARSRRFATYSIDELGDGNRAQQIVDRFFEVPEVIEPIPRWKEGEYHLLMDVDEIMQFASPEYWYIPDSPAALKDERRPKTLQVALFVGINQVVVDERHLKVLNEHYGGKNIPVVFTFNDSNTVPISYFGPNVSLEEVATASQKRGINLAEAPMWELGDHHLTATNEELNTFFELPAVGDIPPERRQALEADLEANGFSKKPVFVSVIDGPDAMFVDQPQRVAVAAAMGIKNIPLHITIVQPDILVQRCGPGVPLGADGSAVPAGDVIMSNQSGTTPPGGIVPPPGGIVPPPPEPEASDS
jgi:hypothetical protein